MVIELVFQKFWESFCTCVAVSFLKTMMSSCQHCEDLHKNFFCQIESFVWVAHNDLSYNGSVDISS